MSTRFRLWAIVLILLSWFVTTARAQENAVVTGRVTTKDDGLSLPGATVSMPALNKSATTDKEGRYEIVVPSEQAKGQTVELRVSFPGLRDQSMQIKLSPGSITQDILMGLSFFEEITVGSRVSGPAAEKAVPVTVLPSEELTSVASTETSQIIQALTPAFNFPRPTITDGTDSVRPATLRGLGPDHVLVLINGKRRHPSALVHVNGSIGRGSTGVDLNAIPASMIRRVEILRDGAAAQYGSDAIAGVINVVLKQEISPLTVSFKGGATTHYDGEFVDTSGTYGWRVLGGVVSAAVEYRDRRETNRAGPDLDPRNTPTVRQPTFHWGDSDARDFMTFVSAEMPLEMLHDASFYGFGGWSRRTGSHGGFYRRARQDTNWPQIYPDGFLPLIEPDIIDWSATGGVRGVKSNWFWDLSTQFSYNSFDFNVRNSLNTSLGASIPPNQTEFYSGSLIFNHFMMNADLTRQVDVGLAGPLNVAFGAEYRRENYEIVAGELASYVDGGAPNQFGGRSIPGAQVFPGFRPSNEVDAVRNSVAGFVDVEADVHPLVRLGVAGRFEHYDDFGNTADGKITARFQPHESVVLRAATSTGFRAPSLGQSHFTSTATNFLPVGGVLVPFEVSTFAVGSPEARILGARDLTPEESVHFSGGIVVNPIQPLEVSLDLYRIDLDDRIVLTENFTGAAIGALLGLPSASARYFTNAIDTKTTGFDLNVTYRRDLEQAGKLRVSAGYNNTDTKIERIAQAPPQLAAFQSIYFGPTEARRFTCGQPGKNLRITGDWDFEQLSTVFRASRYGDYCLVDRRVVDQMFGSEWIFDLEFTYRYKQSILGFGIQNLSDNFPDFNLPANSNAGIFSYPSHSPFGMNGRFMYGRITYTF